MEKVAVNPQEGGCWMWTAGVTVWGYGSFWIGQRMDAHRASWTLHRGPIPSGALVLHRCDRPGHPEDISYRRCVRPEHLYLGDDAQNARDMISRRRHWSSSLPPKLPRPPRDKLNERDVREILARMADGESTASLARRYSVSRPCISMIANGHTWAHVPGARVPPAPQQKLTPDLVAHIANGLARGTTQRQLAGEAGISKTLVYNVAVRLRRAALPTG